LAIAVVFDTLHQGTGTIADAGNGYFNLISYRHGTPHIAQVTNDLLNPNWNWLFRPAEIVLYNDRNDTIRAAARHATPPFSKENIAARTDGKQGGTEKGCDLVTAVGQVGLEKERSSPDRNKLLNQVRFLRSPREIRPTPTFIVRIDSDSLVKLRVIATQVALGSAGEAQQSGNAPSNSRADQLIKSVYGRGPASRLIGRGRACLPRRTLQSPNSSLTAFWGPK